MRRTFAFVSSSFEYTRGVLPVARALEQSGFAVYWITFRGYERYWLLQKGVPPERVLDTLAAFRPGRRTPEELTQQLLQLENGAAPRVNDIVLMDRLLRRKPAAFAYAYLAHLEETLSSWLRQHDIRFVSAGRDTALQIACAKICARLGIPSVVPTSMRLPDDHYGFCLGHTEAEFLRFRTVTETDRERARQFLRLFRETRPVPHNVFVERRNNSFVGRLPGDVAMYGAFFLRGLRDLGNDFTRYSLRSLFGMYVRRRLNALHVRLAPPFAPLGERPFVIYAYHMQPESSVDVLASFLSDQPALIRQIARSLPASHELYVKPHQDHVGGLSRGELLALTRIPGVRLVSPYLPSHDLMLRASVIVTLTGTMAFQGALHGVPSIIFAPQFFRRLPGVHHCSSPLELPALLASVLAEPRGEHDEEIVQFLAQQFANSFVGRVSPYPGAFSEAEIDGLVQAYDTAYRRLVREAPARAALA
jgi:hypothetical protein